MRGVVLVVVALLALSAVASAGIGAQSTPTVEVAVPEAIDEGSTSSGELVVTDVDDPDGVGSFVIELEYDPEMVSIAASEASDFHLEQNTDEPGVLRLVGYTGQLPGPDGNVTLALLDVTGEGEGSTTIDPIVESLTTADGDELAASVVSTSVSVTADEDDSASTPTPPSDDADDDAPSDDDAYDDVPSDDGADDGVPSDDDASDDGEADTTDDAAADDGTDDVDDEVAAGDDVAESDDEVADDGGFPIPGFGVTVSLLALLVVVVLRAVVGESDR